MRTSGRCIRIHTQSEALSTRRLIGFVRMSAGCSPLGTFMEKYTMLKSNTSDARPAWRAPELQELGNLRTLVRVGASNGKSGAFMDGRGNCGGEAMQMVDRTGC